MWQDSRTALGYRRFRCQACRQRFNERTRHHRVADGEVGHGMLRPSNRHWTFDSRVREQPLTLNPLFTSSPAEGERTITSGTSGRVSSHVNSPPERSYSTSVPASSRN